MSANRWRRVTPNHPCPVCHTGDWCRVTADGQLAGCMRVEPGSFRSKAGRDGSTVYLHRLADGPRADRLVGEFQHKPGVDMVAPFGQTLHVSGTDRRSLEAAIQPYRRDPYRWTEVQPTLEDVFIHLMRTHAPPEVKAA